MSNTMYEKPTHSVSRPARIACGMICMIVLVMSEGSGDEPTKSHVRDRVALAVNATAAHRVSSSTPTCGIYAVGRAVELLGGNFDYPTAMRVEYIGNEQGSSATELSRLIADRGYQSVYSSTLTKWEIASLGLPLILHVRSTPDAPFPDHWICVMCDKAGVHVFDGRAGQKTVTLADVLSTWDGNCIVVGTSYAIVCERILSVRVAFISVVCVGIGILCVAARKCVVLWPKQLLSQVAIIGAVSLACAVIGNAFLADISQFRRIAQISQQPFLNPHLKEMTLDKIVEAGAEPSILLLDATSPATFNESHIPGAVNLPAETPESELAVIMNGVDRSTPVVVYCWSRYCGFDEFVARRLVRLGFRDVSIGSEGTSEYLALTADTGK